MNETIKCQECGGSKCQNVSGTTYRCLYCGSTFTVKPPSSVPPEQPVATAAPQPQVIYINQPAPAVPHYQTQPIRGNKDKATALLLTFFLGGLGIQWFYLGKNFTGVVSLLTCWTGIPSIIALVQFFVLLCTSREEFDRQYNS